MQADRGEHRGSRDSASWKKRGVDSEDLLSESRTEIDLEVLRRWIARPTQRERHIPKEERKNIRSIRKLAIIRATANKEMSRHQGEYRDMKTRGPAPRVSENGDRKEKKGRLPGDCCRELLPGNTSRVWKPRCTEFKGELRASRNQRGDRRK